jgi:hypothetical protein
LAEFRVRKRVLEEIGGWNWGFGVRWWCLEGLGASEVVLVDGILEVIGGCFWDLVFLELFWVECFGC